MQISVPGDYDLAPETLAVLKTAPPLNVFRMAARAPASLEPFIALARSVLVGSKLDPKLRELAVLRVAELTGATYVLEQHRMLATAVGLTEREIAGEDLDEMALLVRSVADEVTLEVRLTDGTLATVVEELGTQQATELVLCCSYFNMVCRFTESLRVPL
jgi:AhpD family alkylhydroperoxidase